MTISRREFLTAAVGGSCTLHPTRRGLANAQNETPFRLALHAWERDSRNPIFVPSSTFDARGAQGPFVVLHEGKWWMYYAGIGADGLQRICLATADPEKPTEWERHGPILESGSVDAFDERSATYPRVHRIRGKWHLYYSGRSSRDGGTLHFSNYWGIGLAQSDDLRHWKKYSTHPVLKADGIREYPDCQALVGLGNITELTQPDGRVQYRMYYTLLPGLKDPDWQKNGTWHVIEHKVCAAAHSWDGIEWTDRQLVIERRRAVPTEDIGVVGLNVWRTRRGYRGIYTALGTRYKTYALAEAASHDGLTWERGGDASNVSLTLQPDAWDSGMIGYPCILNERDRLRLFYNGAGGGATGIGMAVARQLDG